MDIRIKRVYKVPSRVRAGRVTLLFGSKEKGLNDAVALKGYLESCERY